MGLWSWYKRRWFEKLDAEKWARETRQLRQALQIEEGRVGLFELDEGELLRVSTSSAGFASLSE